MITNVLLVLPSMVFAGFFISLVTMFDTKLNTWFIGVVIVIEAVTWAILMMRKEETNYHRFTIGAICACVLMIVAIVSVYAGMLWKIIVPFQGILQNTERVAAYVILSFTKAI